GCDRLEIFRVVTLQTRHKRNSHSTGQIGILAVSFLPASPARVAKNIDIGRPEIETFVDIPPSCADSLIVLGSSFLSNRRRHLMNQGSVERCGQPDRFRKDGGSSRTGNAMQSFTPP